MIVNHVFIGPGPVKASDLFNILTWVGIGATVNVYVAHPHKRSDEVQHTYESLFNLKQDMGNGATMKYDVGTNLFSRYKIVNGRAVGVASAVRLISLPATLEAHDEEVPEQLRELTSGWKTGIVKFLSTANTWWFDMEKVFTMVDATKFYLSATKVGLTCDMKVAPTKYFRDYEDAFAEKYISFQRGNAAVAGFENQCSGSMCALTDRPRVTYATSGQRFGNGFGAKSVETARRSFEQITAEHGKAMQKLEKAGLGADSTKLPGVKTVVDPEIGWKGPLCVWKHPKDQSWAGRTLGERDKLRAAQDIDRMTTEALKLVMSAVGADDPLYKAMVEISKFPGFNLYA